MATISNGEGGLSVRNKLNEIINKVEGSAQIDNNITFSDGSKAIFGAGSDLQIYHDGQHSYIDDVGTGQLRIRATNLEVTNSSGTQNMIVATDGGSVSLRYAGSTKMQTTSTGIDVTGTVTADGLTVEKAGASQVVADFSSTGANAYVQINDVNSTNFAGFGVTTDALSLWTSNSEAMRIDSSGNVGIGTSSPSVDLHVAGGSSASVRIEATATGNPFLSFFQSSTEKAYIQYLDSGDLLTYQSDGGHKWLYSGSSEAMRIDSSGNVGIGTSSPSDKLTVQSEVGSVNGITLKDSGGSNSATFGQNPSTGEIRIGSSKVNYFPTFYSNNAESMRIDSSGNLLVGKTDTNLATAGHTLWEDGRIDHTRDSSFEVMILNKLNNDGNIVTFRKDGTTVGSIGTSSSGLYIGNASGLRFDDGSNRVLPYNAETPTTTDGTLNLGAATSRFKDLYLSGGVYLGGTGAANKLDDYEEGTWTPTAGGSTTDGTATYVRQIGRYVKVGNLLHLAGWLEFNSFTGTGSFLIKGAPFTGKSVGYLVPPGSVIMESIVIPSNRTSLAVRAQDGQSFLRLYATGSNVSSSQVQCEAAGTVVFSCQYEVN